ncbi:polysaccharide biosynthesis/export family protein [Sphingomonas sp. 2R-10]|uniref:polysaccharide biosynthesis/export family protein n=1 Tax=Sphingomonas sp. 2R-10 TaxID=3045148 RepID=UPI000F7AB7F2|nr:polysaccharide biosynthesis/export family protein [Sphingomonas sp. 2R-10]MDJ0275587.1 polysaccharide biosynthesis/export family protein [Sphingomonas sp. 2R-10]
MDNGLGKRKTATLFTGLGVTALLLSACGGATPPVQQAPVASTPLQNGTGGDVYTLGIGDRVRISTFNEPSLSGEFQVGGKGTISFPLIGDVPAQDKTGKQLEAVLVERLGAGYIRNPRVTVEVLSYRPFFILGEVSRPGQYPTFDGMTLSRAIALAGGYTYRANRKQALIRHPGATQEQRVTIDSDVRIQPGDVVRIGERYF